MTSGSRIQPGISGGRGQSTSDAGGYLGAIAGGECGPGI